MAQVRSKRAVWSRPLPQLVGCVAVAAVLPLFSRALFLDAQSLPLLRETFFGCLTAIVLGTWLLRNLTTYPGVETSAYILPAFTISFFALLMVFVLGRLDYNRAQLALGYVLSVAWFFVVHLAVGRRQLLRIGYLPVGERARPPGLDSVQWVMLSDATAVPADLDAVATDLRVDLPEEWDRRLADIALAGTPVFHVKHLLESLTGRVELEHLSENSFGSLMPMSTYQSIKRVGDIVTAALAGVALLPFLLIVALLVRLTSPGPALFRQSRIGYRGRPFTVYKFRTMTALQDRSDPRAAAITLSNDQRVTRFGRFLRTSRIDELPQILNILRGEMSWIGPRPEAAVLSAWYEREIPFYRYRHIVRPGIAGWAQVCQGHVSEVDEVRSKLHYDFYYIKQFSPWIDLLIVALTLRTVLTGYGSR